MTTSCTTDAQNPTLETIEQKKTDAASSGLQSELSNRIVIDEEDILGTMTSEYILIDLNEPTGSFEVGALPTVFDDVDVVADNFAGHQALTYEQPADEAAHDAIVARRAQRIEEEDDSIRELATTGDGV